MDRFHIQPLDQSIIYALDFCIHNQKFDNCLDAGCGGGQHTSTLLKRCKNVIGIDIDPSRMSKATKASILKMPFRDKTFDFIFSNQVFEHIYPKDYTQYFSEIFRVCKKGGKIVIATPNQFAPTRFLELTFKDYLDTDHKNELNYLSAIKIKKQLQKSFKCDVKLYGYSSIGRKYNTSEGYRKRLKLLWTILPKSFSVLANKYPPISRGFVFYIQK